MKTQSSDYIIFGVHLNPSKSIFSGLCSIYGIGKNNSLDIINKCSLKLNTKVKDLNKDDISKIIKIIENEYKVEGNLRKEEKDCIKRMIAINCYKGFRHRMGYPVRGQNTKNNARTRKGKKKAVKKTIKK